jgi:dTDP-4-amino-4,6-dideoxygalactose transaminase
MHVPFIDLHRSVNPIEKAVHEDWQNALANCEFVGGPTVARLEKSLEDKLDASHFTCCSNGTDALMVGMQAMGVKPGMRVALPNMTFWAPYEAVALLGATPVLVDMNPDDLQMDFDEFKRGHEQFRFDAAILVHLFGWASSRLQEFRDYCKENEITLIEDGAQSFGVTYNGESVYKNAQLATISFYPAKVFGGCGDGGGITTDDPTTGEKIRALCNHGRAGHYTYDYVGWNARMGGLTAHYLMRMLEQIDGFVESRLQAEAFYYEYFQHLSDHCKIFKAPEGIKGNGYLAVIQSHSKSGDDIAGALKDKGIGCARTYPQTICEQPPAHNALRTSDLQHSKRFSRQVINLPLFANITQNECQISADALKSVFKDG